MILPQRRHVIAVLVHGVALVILLSPVTVRAQNGAATRPLRVIDPAFIDTTVQACTDFWQFANGGWLKHDTIPAAYSSSGMYREMGDRNELVVRSVLEDVALHRKTLKAGSTERKLGVFYASCMDSTAAESAGLTPLQAQLAEIDGVTSRPRLLAEIATLQMRGVSALFDYSPDIDPHDAARYIVWLGQGGLGLPDVDYYTKLGASADSTRHQYVDHVAHLLILAGETAAVARRDAERVLTLETELARASLTRVERRDPKALDHPMSVAELKTLASNIEWKAYFAQIGLKASSPRVNVAEPEFFKRVNALIETLPLDDWRTYLRYHALAAAAPWLSRAFVKEDFAFSSKFSGAKEQLPRWKRCLRAADGQIGEALGQAYIMRAFSADAKARARTVIDDIRAAFKVRLEQLTWMSDATRKSALDKLAKMHEKVGYPDRWRDYSRLDVTEGPFVLNSQHANIFEWRRVVNRPGSAVDTTEWEMTVPTVNAYYDPSKNEMVFPAGALTPQPFDPQADDAANYGALGAGWAGHELTHGFDDEGRHYDAAGNLRDWWTPTDSSHFTRQAEIVVQQYNGYIQVDTFHVNGPLTLGENIADIGGLFIGYDAMQRALQRDGRPGLIDGYTPEQRFFIAFAQSSRVHARPEMLRSRVTVDPHAPDNWRVNGPLSDMPAFAKTFGCKPGDPMVRPSGKVANIW